MWLPVVLGLGVGVYFHLHDEPSLILLLLATIIAAAITFYYWKQQCVEKGMLGLVVALFIGGMASGALRTAMVSEPFLHDQAYPQQVEGTVERIDTQPKNTRLLLNNVAMERVNAEATPQRVTISLRERAPRDIEIGDRVKAYAGFFPPPAPALPGGFQFNRHFFFEGIGATGYALGKEPPEIVVKQADASPFMSRLTAFRHGISDWLRDEMGERHGAVAAALIAGEKRAITSEDREYMRKAGLAHVLAISGMHLGLVAAILFYSARLLLVAIPGVALRFHAKKWAAVIAALGALGYLFMAGLPISAQRAYVMVGLVLLAVMLDRMVTPVRSLALAAFLILLFTPEAVLTPSFQLSFAATLGILAYYEHWRETLERESLRYFTFKERVWRFWSGIFVTSGIATLATAPFIIHHFDDFPTYSILGNLLALPVVSFLIMPTIVCIMLLLPFGGAGWLLPILKAALAFLLTMAQWVAELPYSTIFLPPLSTTGLIIAALGGLWLCLWQGKWRHAGWVVVAAGMMTLFFYRAPDMLISADAKKIALRTAPERVVMQRGQRKGFTQDQWRRFMRVDEFSLYRRAHDGEVLKCDVHGCMFESGAVNISIVRDRQALVEDCKQAKLTVVPEWSAYRTVKERCKGEWVLGRYWFERVMGAAFWFEDDGWIRLQTVRDQLGNRPWVRKE